MTLFNPNEPVDWHAHVFTAGVGVVEGARYAPSTSATPDEFISHFTSAGFQKGLLIQPSFLGTDNSQMLEAIAQHPERLKGIAVVPIDIDAESIRALTGQGIIGCRLNLFGKDAPDLEQPQWRSFLARIANADWQLELHAPPGFLNALLPQLESFESDIVIDHFGRPDPSTGPDTEEYSQFLKLLDQERHWIKTSAWYRLGTDPEKGLAHARAAKRMLDEHGMGDRMLWGSDWPHTQHPEITYDFALEAREAIAES